MLNALEAAVSRTPYLTGDAFTAADLYVGANLTWAMMFGTVEKRPAFEAFTQRVNDRPAAKRAGEMDDADKAEAEAAS